MAKSDFRPGTIKYEFIAIPKVILRSLQWQQLPHSSRALALDLAAQYTGKNNGRLTTSIEAMARCGWTSKGTLIRAKKHLQECDFIVRTRKGHAPRTAEWFGFTWWKIDFERSMDIDPKYFPYLNFMNLESARIDPNIGREASPKKRSVRFHNETDTSIKQGLRRSKIGPMEAADVVPSVSNQHHAP